MAGRQIQGRGGRRHRLLTSHDLAGIIGGQGGNSGNLDPSMFATAAQGARADSAVQSIVAGANVTVNSTDPLRPIISASGSGGGGNYIVPPFSNVAALLHFDGADGSNTFVDQVVGNTWTPYNATISTSQAMFGGSSGKFITGGSNSAITMPTNSKFQLGSDFWTLEISVYLSSVVGTNMARVFQTTNGDGITAISLTVLNNNVLGLFHSFNGTSWGVSNASITTLANNTWYRILIERVGSSVIVFINGYQITTLNVGSNSLATTMSDTLIIGGQSIGTNRSFPGYIDEFRFTRGLPLVSSYTLTDSEFPNT